MTVRPTRGIYVARLASTGQIGSFPATGPSYALGDTLCSTRTGRTPCKSDPCLRKSAPPHSVDKYPPSAHWLIYSSPSGQQLRAIVRLPFSKRRNTPANAAFAIRRVMQFDATMGALFMLAMNGVDPLAAAWSD